MPVVILKLPNVDGSPRARPPQCPYCGSQILQRWGRVSKSVSDTDHGTVHLFRYRCADCARTFRDYPDGVDRARLSPRIRHLAAIAWALGLSHNEVVEAFERLGIALSPMSVWRNGQALATRLGSQGALKPLPAYSIDRVYLPHASTKLGVVVAIAVESGQLSVLGTVDECNPRAVMAWLATLVQKSGIEVRLLGTGWLNHSLESGWAAAN